DAGIGQIAARGGGEGTTFDGAGAGRRSGAREGSSKKKKKQRNRRETGEGPIQMNPDGGNSVMHGACMLAPKRGAACGFFRVLSAGRQDGRTAGAAMSSDSNSVVAAASGQCGKSS